MPLNGVATSALCSVFADYLGFNVLILPMLFYSAKRNKVSMMIPSLDVMRYTSSSTLTNRQELHLIVCLGGHPAKYYPPCA